MAKINLTSKEWCELVFEGKNKEFGAYILRKESAKRHNVAMLIVMVVAVLAFTLPSLIRSFIPEKTKEVMTEVTTLSQLPPPEVKNNDEIKRVDAPPPPPLKSSIKFTAPVIKRDSEVADEDEVKSQEDLNATNTAISIADVKGNDEINGSDIADIKEVAPNPGEVIDDKPYSSVEQMPEFPGGMEKLMEFLQKNIIYPTIASENAIQGRVIVRFVVKRDGKISNIEILRSVDPSLDKEAIRVVKAMPDWIPGKQNGNSVPVYFTLPVTFRLR